MKTTGIVIGTLCAIGIGVGMYYAIAGSGGSSSRILQLDPSYVQREKDGFWKMGNTKDPKTTLLIYNDFQCPSCVAEYGIVQQAAAQISPTTEIEFRNYPMSATDDNAELAAQAAESAGAQGHFWDMYLLLYANNAYWSTASTADATVLFDKYAQALNLNSSQFNQDLNSSMIQSQINADQTAANSLSITSAPALVLNGQLLAEPPTTSAALVAAIKAAQ